MKYSGVRKPIARRAVIAVLAFTLLGALEGSAFAIWPFKKQKVSKIDEAESCLMEALESLEQEMVAEKAAAAEAKRLAEEAEAFAHTERARVEAVLKGKNAESATWVGRAVLTGELGVQASPLEFLERVGLYSEKAEAYAHTVANADLLRMYDRVAALGPGKTKWVVSGAGADLLERGHAWARKMRKELQWEFAPLPEGQQAAARGTHQWALDQARAGGYELPTHYQLAKIAERGGTKIRESAHFEVSIEADVVKQEIKALEAQKFYPVYATVVKDGKEVTVVDFYQNWQNYDRTKGPGAGWYWSSSVRPGQPDLAYGLDGLSGDVVDFYRDGGYGAARAARLR